MARSVGPVTLVRIEERSAHGQADRLAHLGPRPTRRAAEVDVVAVHQDVARIAAEQRRRDGATDLTGVARRSGHDVDVGGRIASVPGPEPSASSVREPEVKVPSATTPSTRVASDRKRATNADVGARTTSSGVSIWTSSSMPRRSSALRVVSRLRSLVVPLAYSLDHTHPGGHHEQPQIA